jgi:hypothetical protein
MRRIIGHKYNSNTINANYHINVSTKTPKNSNIASSRQSSITVSPNLTHNQTDHNYIYYACIRCKGLTGARRDSRAGRTSAGGSGTEVEADPLTLLASFRSFFHETMVVSPGRSSTVNICRSPALTNDEEALDDSPPPTPTAFSSSISASQILGRPDQSFQNWDSRGHVGQLCDCEP